MTDERLASRARELGVMVSYRDWRRRPVRVGQRSLAAVVQALEAAGPPGAAGPPAVPGSRRAGPGRAAAPQAPPLAPPERRAWGLTVQLYSVRSRRSWGHGDLRDLAELAAWSARELGAGFIQVNPLHAAAPAPPVGDSPYLPMTRRYISPLYIRIEDIPEYRRLPAEDRGQIEDLAAPLRAASGSGALIDRDRVWAAKRRALELVHRVPRSGERESQYRSFTSRQGEDLAAWAAWCALAERHGPDWRAWTARLRDPRAGAAEVAAGPLAARAEFHAWAQWLADSQLAAAQAAARAAGMAIGVIGDLAVGAHPGGADAWAWQGLLVPGMSVGAPPDGFNQRGQDWSQPPWHPGLLAAAGYRPLAGMLRAAFRHVGGVRADHVLGLMRLWWIPDGLPPAEGAYVRYDHRAMTAVLTGAAAEAGAVAIGEDLGTAEPWFRRYLAGRGVLGTEMAWFATERGGRPRRPERWRRLCLATVGTHDVPPVAAFVSGEQVAVRERLGLLTDPEAERRAAGRALAAWRRALAERGLLPPGGEAGPGEFTVAMYRFLARTPALLLGVSLADAVGERRAQNIPGTSSGYPNWRVPLCDARGDAVLVEDLPRVGLLRSLARAVSG